MNALERIEKFIEYSGFHISEDRMLYTDDEYHELRNDARAALEELKGKCISDEHSYEGFSGATSCYRCWKEPSK